MSLEKIKNPQYWRDINSHLTISEDGSKEPVGTAFNIDWKNENFAKNLIDEGYINLGELLSNEEVAAMHKGIMGIKKQNFIPIFCLVYDEFWNVACRLRNILNEVIEENYCQLPAIWVWYVDKDKEESGWEPHRDNASKALLDNGMPKSVTIWVALSDATTENGCMYIFPPCFDKNYKESKQSTIIPQAIRSLFTPKKYKKNDISPQSVYGLPVPVNAGTILLWNHQVLHWGGKSSKSAKKSRVSMAFEFQRFDTIYKKTDVIHEPYKLLPFDKRLSLIGKQILGYNKFENFTDELLTVAEDLKGLYPNEL